MQVKEAVQKAKQYLPEIFESAAGQELRLEGVEKNLDGSVWKVTFSYGEDIRKGRDYKTVKPRNTDGELLGARNGYLLEDEI